MISFIVSVYDRFDHLNVCVDSLHPEVQKQPNTVIICDNGIEDTWMRIPHGGHRLYTGRAGARSCYESANMVIIGDCHPWLCFPSDDSYYLPMFSEVMLATAEKENADFVYCDCLYSRPVTPGWELPRVLVTEPRIGKIDKTCFIVKREWFKGFPPHPQEYCDGAFVEQLVRDGARIAKAPGVLVVHN